MAQISKPETRGSGSDKNSDNRRLARPENLLDKMSEDSFPASDPPSTSPMTGVGRTEAERDPSHLPEDFKESGAAQFKYGQQSQASTQHFDTSTHRLKMGNPDVGDVDLGTIEADKPAKPDKGSRLDS